jgi:hypothetical protein
MPTASPAALIITKGGWSFQIQNRDLELLAHAARAEVMLTNATADKLREMKLGIMATQFKSQLMSPDMANLSFEERFGLIVDAEYANRKSNRLVRLIKSAAFAYPSACLEDVEYHADRGLDKSLILRLGTCAA